MSGQTSGVVGGHVGGDPNLLRGGRAAFVRGPHGLDRDSQLDVGADCGVGEGQVDQGSDPALPDRGLGVTVALGLEFVGALVDRGEQSRRVRSAASPSRHSARSPAKD